MRTAYVPAVELVYVHVDVPVAPGAEVQETAKPVPGIVKEANETLPVKPRLVTVMVEVVEDPDAKETVFVALASLKSGP